MEIRLASIKDSNEILKIYNEYILTPITFENLLPSKEEFKKRIKEINEFYPYLVWEETGKIVAYAYAHKYKEREAYGWGSELSVYISKSHCKKGIGEKLYKALIEILKVQGVRTVYGCVTLPNVASEKLHEKMGFRLVGIITNAGYKAGSWHNVSWWEKQINEYNKNPSKVKSILEIPKDKIENIIKDIKNI